MKTKPAGPKQKLEKFYASKAFHDTIRPAASGEARIETTLPKGNKDENTAASERNAAPGSLTTIPATLFIHLTNQEMECAQCILRLLQAYKAPRSREILWVAWKLTEAADVVAQSQPSGPSGKLVESLESFIGRSQSAQIAVDKIFSAVVRGQEDTSRWVCRQCGCMNHTPCPRGCSWVEKDLCDRCLGYADNFSKNEASVLARALVHLVSHSSDLEFDIAVALLNRIRRQFASASSRPLTPGRSSAPAHRKK